MAGTIIADSVEAAATSQMVIKNGISSAPPQFQDGAGTQIGTLCRAWVNFNGTGTVAIRASFNVSSITDHAVGEYTVNLTNAMPDINYAVAASAQSPATSQISIAMFNYFTAGPTLTKVDPTASAFRFICTLSTSPYAADPPFAMVNVFR